VQRLDAKTRSRPVEQNFFNVVISAAGAAVAWVIKMIYDRIKDLQTTDERLSSSVEEIKKNYVRRDDFKDFAHDIKDTLIRIEGKIDAKVDK
jgi:hypothetical protein